MGLAHKERLDTLKISWDHVVARLLRMKVAVVNTSAPFVRGGAEHLAESLVHELASRGHEVELVKVPLRWATPDEVAESMFAAACLRIPVRTA